MSNEKSILLLVLFAFILRILFIFQGAVSFHYDMSRDAFVVKQILEGDLKIQGPPTSTPGLYHGVLYYYLIAPFYKLGNGDPRVVALFLSLINSLTIIPLALICKSIFKEKKWMVLSGIVYAVAFEATQYGSWVSNPSPSIFCMGMFFYSLVLWKSKNKWGLPLATFWAALSMQFQFFLGYLFILLPIYKFIFSLRASKKDLLISTAAYILILGSFIISTTKFHNYSQVIGGVSNIVNPNEFRFKASFIDIFSTYVNKYTELFINNIFPVNVLLGGILGLLTLYAARQNKFILFALLSNLPLFLFSSSGTFVNQYGMITPIIIGLVNLLTKVYIKKKLIFYLLIIGIIFSNLYMIIKIAPQGQVALVIPKDMVLNKELKLIDKTYELAKGQPFSINSLTLPLWTNTTWAYLYWWYGKNKYGYVPSFTGHNQIGLLGVNDLPLADKPEDKAFFIIEPHIGIPDDRYTLEIGSENSKTELIKEFLFGELRLQFRKPKN